MAGGPIPNLRVWGTWLEQQPPQIGSELLLRIAKKERPLMIFDPFRYAHGADENDSTEMMKVMQQLRHCAAMGAAVVVLHHPAKSEAGAGTGRGSSAIRGAADVALVQERCDETDVITLRCVKNRFGERWIETIKPDFVEGTFEVTDSPQWARRNADVEKLKEFIKKSPGINQIAISKAANMKKARLLALLREEEGTSWRSVKDRTSLRYFPPVPFSGTGPGTGEQVTE
jgi:AAA domain-containing protein